MWTGKISKILLTYLISATIISEFLLWYSCYDYLDGIRFFINNNSFIIYAFLILIYLLCTFIFYKNIKMRIKHKILLFLYMFIVFLMSALLLYLFFNITTLIHVIIVFAINDIL